LIDVWNSREPRALDLHAAEGAHVRMPVGAAAPWAAPVLHLHHFLVGLAHEVLHDVLLAQPVAAGHGVVEVVLQAVVRLGHGGSATLGRHRVAAHRVDLRDQRDAQRRIGLGHRDGGSQAGAAGTDDRDICLECFHVGPQRVSTSFWYRPP
jgi:hypothetical protein